jgi:hypothetical protein
VDSRFRGNDSPFAFVDARPKAGHDARRRCRRIPSARLRERVRVKGGRRTNLQELVLLLTLASLDLSPHAGRGDANDRAFEHVIPDARSAMPNPRGNAAPL